MAHDESDDRIPFFSVAMLLIAHGWVPRLQYRDTVVFLHPDGPPKEPIYFDVIDLHVSRADVERIRSILRRLED